MTSFNFQAMLAVSRWEFIEKVRTKAFIISLLLTPFIMILFAVVPTMLANLQSDKTMQFGLWDGTHGIAQHLNDSLSAQYKLQNNSPRYKLALLNGTAGKQAVDSAKQRIFSGEFTGVFVIPPDIEKTRTIEYYSENIGNERDITAIQSLVEKTLTYQQLAHYAIDPKIYDEISRKTTMRSFKLSKDGSEQSTGFLEQFFGMYGSILIVMMMISMTGQIMVRSMLDEKSNRIIEILLSSCRPSELMLGKLIGLSGLGIVQGLLWILLSGGLSIFLPMAASFLGFLPLVICFALLGYFFYAALLIGLGSTTTTEQEAQTMTGYTIMISAMPFVFIFPLLQEPNGVLARILSFVPFLTPSIMSARIFLQTPPWWEIMLAILSMFSWIIIVTFVSAKIFRIGILTYGKKMTLKEITAAIRS